MKTSYYIQKYLDLGFTVCLIKPRQKFGTLGTLYARSQINLETDCNIGLRLGNFLHVNVSEDSRFIHALDFDTFPGYEAWAAANPELANTPTQITHRGMHVLFTLPYQCRNGKSPGLDVIGDSWHILVQPSIHPEGTHYTWLHSPFDTDIVHVNDIREIGINPHEIDWEPDDYDDYRPSTASED